MRPAAVTVAVIAALAAPASALAVAHGRDAPVGSYPWMGTIIWKRAGDNVRNLHCGATLIAPDRLLTAAHCVAGLAPRDVRVYLGLDRLTRRGATALPVAGFRVLRGYRVVPSPVRPRDFEASATTRDAALILLAAPVTDVAPVALPGPLDGALTAAGVSGLLLGHGRTTARGGAGAPADALREAPQELLSRARCRARFGALFAPDQLCAIDRVDDPPAGACAGDSGGPLVTLDLLRGPVQVGILVYGGETQGLPCEASGFPDVYTAVAGLRAFAGVRGL